MLSLGIDPGLIKTGLALIEYDSQKDKYHCLAHKLLKIDKTNPMQKRLADLYLNVMEFILSLKERPNIIGIEQTLCNTNALSSLNLAMARGTIMSVLGNNFTNTKIVECNPRSVKRILTGDGNADKEVIRKCIGYILPKEETDDFSSYDEFDAVAIAYTAIHSDRFIVGVERRMVG